MMNWKGYGRKRSSIEVLSLNLYEWAQERQSRRALKTFKIKARENALPHRRYRKIYEDNIKMDINETAEDDVNEIHLTSGKGILLEPQRNDGYICEISVTVGISKTLLRCGSMEALF
jgi:hypothetical protein